jgi:hypothetical protein
VERRHLDLERDVACIVRGSAGCGDAETCFGMEGCLRPSRLPAEQEPGEEDREVPHADADDQRQALRRQCRSARTESNDRPVAWFV